MTLFTAIPSNGSLFEEKYELRKNEITSVFDTFLTYELKSTRADNPNRDLLIVKDSFKVRKHIIDHSSRQKFNIFIKRISYNIYNKRNKTFAYHKIAFQLLKEEIRLANTVVAINIHGCVPVFLSEHTVNVYYKGQAIKARIAIMPGLNHLNEKDTQSFKNNYPIEKYQLVKRNTFRGLLQFNLPLFFKKHYEDIEDLLSGIIHNSNVYSALLRAKLIEEVIGTSITIKLKNLEQIEQQLSKKDLEAYQLCKAKRLFFLYLVNEIYKILGVNAKGGYANKCALQLRSYLNTFSGNPIAQYLSWMLEHKNKFNILSDPIHSGLNITDLPSWVNQLHAFCCFLLSLKASMLRQGLEIPLEKGCVYLPGIENSEFGIYHKHNNSAKVKILNPSDQAGIDHRYLIWLADLVLLPKRVLVNGTIHDAKSLANSMYKRVEEEGDDLSTQLIYAERLRIIRVMQGWLRGIGKDLAKAICKTNKDYYLQKKESTNFYYRIADLRGFTEKPSVLNKLDFYNNARTLWVGKEKSAQKKPFKFLKVTKDYPISRKFETIEDFKKRKIKFPKSNKYQGNILDIIRILLPDYSKEAQVEIFLEVIAPWLSKDSK